MMRLCKTFTISVYLYSLAEALLLRLAQLSTHFVRIVWHTTAHVRTTFRRLVDHATDDHHAVGGGDEKERAKEISPHAWMLLDRTLRLVHADVGELEPGEALLHALLHLVLDLRQSLLHALLNLQFVEC